MLKELARTLVAGAFHCIPIKSGLTRLCFNPAINWLLRHGPSTLQARLRDGRQIEVSMHDYHGRILYFFGTNDPKVEATARGLLRCGDVFIDIGANYSSIGLAAAHAVGEYGSVHLFEPQSLLGNRVQKAIDLGGYTNVTLHRVGLLDRNDKLILHSPSFHSGMATFAGHSATAHFDRTEECDVRDISAYVAPLVAGRRFGAKLDIEGAEPRVMPWLTSQPNLSFLIFESAHNQLSLFETIRASGLVLYGLERSLVRVKLTRVDQFSEVSRFHDLVAVRTVDDNAPKSCSPQKLGSLLRRIFN